MKLRYFLFLLLALLQSPAEAAIWQPIALTSVSAAPVLAFSSLASGGVVGGSPIAGSGTYTGTAPTSIVTATWGGGCSGSSTVSSFSASAGAWSANFTVPSAAGTGCTIGITDNRSDTATSPSVTILATSYTGPGDIATFSMWGGLRAYNNAIAGAGTQKLVDVTSGLTSNTCSILVSLTGGMGLTTSCSNSPDNGKTPFAFAGTDATGTGAITGTTLTFTGGHIGDVVTGGTTAAYTYITGGSSPSWTVNISQTVISTTLTLTGSLIVTQTYDQTGNGRNCVSNGGVAHDPLLIAPTGSLPHMVALAANQTSLACTITSISQPVSYYAVEERSGDASTNYAFVIGNATLGGLQYLISTSSANTMFVYAGNTPVTATVSDNARHLVQSLANVASSLVNVDGVDGSTGNAGSNGSGTTIDVMGDGAGGGITNNLTGDVEEYGMIAGATTSGTRSSLHTNGSAYWGTP